MESEDLVRDRSPRPLVDAPAFLWQWRWRLLLGMVLIIPFFVPIPRALQNHPVWAGFGDRLHVILLGGVALFLYWFGPLRGRLLRALIGAAIVGGSIEILQLFVGRHALWHDFFQDLIGIGIVLGFVTWRGAGSRAGLVLMCALAMLVPWQMRQIPHVVGAMKLAGERFPLLADFETKSERWIWGEDYDAQLSFARVEAPHGVVMRIRARPEGVFPAAVQRRFPADWSGYRELAVDVRVHAAPGDTVRGNISITDYEGYGSGYRIRQGFLASREWRTIVVPLRSPTTPPGHEVDLTDVFTWRLNIPWPTGETILEVDNARLRSPRLKP